MDVLSSITWYTIMICVGGISCCCNYLNGWSVEMVSFECAGIGYTQGFGELLHREHHGECQERHGDGNHVMVVECVWDFVMDGEAPSGAVAASIVYDFFFL